jgi:hypothetical protein
MTAPNHAITGALIGLALPNMWLGVPLAILSHFVLDAIPHYDVPGDTNEARIGSKQFLLVQILGGGAVCALLVFVLWQFAPVYWFSAAVCAFAAASPDLLSFPRFVSVKRGGHDLVEKNWFWKFHNDIQRQHPRYLSVELVWFGVAATILAAQL